GVIRSLRGQNVFPGTAEDGNWVSGSAETADSLWLGSYGSGVRRFLKAPGARSAVRGSAVRGLIEIDSIGVADGLPTEAVEDVIRTSAGTWAVTRRGLALVRGGRARAMTAEHGLPSSAVFALYEDASGTHWAGTAGGVARLDMTRWRAEAVGETGGRPVVAFVERLAEPGVIYAVTTRGLWQIETGHVEPVDAFPLVRDARTTIEHAVIHGPSDRLILATSAGTALADLSAMPSGATETLPDVAVVSASVDDAPVELLGTPLAVRLEPLAPGRHRVVIEVAALRFGGTAGVEWREAGGAWRTAPEARVVLPDVGPGKHALEIRAVTPGGTASPAATVSFHVAPHWWERSAVRVLAGVLALGVLVGGVRTVSQRRLRARVRELEAAERVRAERERISRDLHDHVGAEVAAILTRAEVARLRATAEGRSADDFHDVETRARRTMGSLREAIWALGLGTLTPEALAGRLGQFAQDQAGPRGPAVDARATGETDRALAPTQALALYRIGQEAVRNAVAHSGGTRLSVIVEATGHRVAVVVRDDGAFGGASGDGGGYGLGNMQARAEALGGTFAVTNGSGTTVRAEIPVA
ncbi:MAG: histidine kinase, partial [Bacteroidota bacterium]